MVFVAVALGGCTARVPPAVATGPAIQRSSDSGGRERVSLTLYNSDLGLVRETRHVELGQGRVSLTYADVPADIRPESVQIRALDAPAALTVFEQNYRYDLLTPKTLLEKYVGRHIRVARYNEKRGEDEIADAELLSAGSDASAAEAEDFRSSASSGDAPVLSTVMLRIKGAIVSGAGYRLIFPGLPPNLVSKPSLVWLLGSTRPRQRLEVSYLTSGLSWSADYVLTLAEDDQSGDLTGWVTLRNDTGTSFRSAELKLVAGDVHRVRDDAVRTAYYAALDDAPPAPALRQERVFEYHLYDLGRLIDVLEREQKQVNLFEARGVALHKRLRYRGLDEWYDAAHGQVVKDQKVTTLLEFSNAARSGLGVPLPKGTVRVYKASRGGALEFVGEDSIDHTPRDETVELEIGKAFDVVVDQSQTSFTTLGKCVTESGWEVVLRNHKEQSERVDIEQPIRGDYTLVNSDPPATRRDAHTLRFEVNVPARGVRKVTYLLRVRTC